MTRQALYHKNPLGEAAILLDDGILLEIAFNAIDHAILVGSVFAGRVRSVNHAAGGAFVDIGLDTVGYLPFKRAPEDLHEGQTLIVLVDRDAVGDKGPRLKLRKGPPPSADETKIKAPCRLSTAPSPVLQNLKTWQAHILSDHGELRRLFPDTEIARSAAFLFDESDIADTLDDLSSRQITLPSGGNIVIEETAALTAIDINSGGTQALSQSNSALTTNLEAIDCIGQQLRWRDLSGIVAIDFLRLKGKADRKKLNQAIQQHLDDNCQAGGFTSTGLYDLTRRRQGTFVQTGFPAFLAVGRILAALRREAKQNHKRPLKLTLSRPLRELWQQVDDEIGEDLRLELGGIELDTNYKYRISDFAIDTA